MSHTPVIHHGVTFSVSVVPHFLGEECLIRVERGEMLSDEIVLCKGPDAGREALAKLRAAGEIVEVSL